MTRAEQPLARAKQLSQAERLRLVDDILDSIDPIDVKIAKQWATEGQSRLEAGR